MQRNNSRSLFPCTDWQRPHQHTECLIIRRRQRHPLKVVNEILSSIRVHRQLGHANLTLLQRPILHQPSSNRPTQAICTTLDREIRQRNLKPIPRLQTRSAKEPRDNLLRRNVQLKVPTVPTLAPLELFVILDKASRNLIAG